MEPKDFDEYLRSGEPGKRERASNWATAIGLQAVDGLQTSEYLRDVARRNIEGDIDAEEAQKLVRSYYTQHDIRQKSEDGTDEADQASANINRLLASPTFSFSVAGLKALHRHIFDGVFVHAGKFRTCDFTKKEWVLNGASVFYQSCMEDLGSVQQKMLNDKWILLRL
ncbi:MAG: cell filamentation protein Fic, partial [Bacteroidales bacterium]|nr:cell filamentation protein Fic [Bacteroidales bacterium]